MANVMMKNFFVKELIKMRSILNILWIKLHRNIQKYI